MSTMIQTNSCCVHPPTRTTPHMTLQVKLVYKSYIRWTIFIKGEFTDWKPERLIADAGGRYCAMRQLPPGK
jgi:hypothetical protein